MQVHTTLSLRYRVIQQLPILRRLPGFPAARVRAGLVPATMRHTWPPGQQGQGIDLVTLAAMLGHSKINMVLWYARPTARHQTQTMHNLETWLPDQKR